MNRPPTRAALALAAGFALAAGTAHAASPSDTALLGVWLPTVGNGGLAELVLTTTGAGKLRVHGWGTCGPPNCDWGTVAGVVYATSVSTAAGTSFTAKFNFGFASEILTGTVQADGVHMTIDEFDTFVATDSRFNYHVSNVLQKQPTTR